MQAVDPIAPSGAPHTVVVDEREHLDQILAIVHEREGVDFRTYRPATLLRRVRNRMVTTGDRSLADYHVRLAASPVESAELFERLTVKVSRFFRNGRAFDALQAALAPRLSHGSRRLRLWSAGCGRGEEAYSLAILAGELGAEAEVLATDLDLRALGFAASGRYPAAALGDADPGRLAPWLEPRPDGPDRLEAGFRVGAELRRRVSFSRHDLTGRRAPPGRGDFDVICCRNVLIYLEAGAQRRVVALLVHRLAPGGLLCLGEAEWPASDPTIGLVLVDRTARLFRRAAGAGAGVAR